MERKANQSMKLRERDAIWGFLLPLSPAFGLIYYGVLATKIKAVIKGIREDRVTLAAMTGMLLVGTVSALLAPYKAKSLLNMPIPIVFIGIYALGRWGIRSPRVFLKAVTLGCGFLGLVVIIARLLKLNIWYGDIPILAQFTGRGNVLGMADNGLAAMLEAGVTGGLGFYLYQQSWRWLYILSSMTSLAAIFMTYSRGSMVGTAGAVILLLAMNSHLLKKHWKLLVGVFLLVILFINYWPGLTTRIQSIFDLTTNTSNIGRLEIWIVTFQMVKNHPILGIGPGLFGTLYPQYRLPDYILARSPHSIYLYVLSGWGLLGFLIFFGWLGMSVVRPLLISPDIYRRIAFAMMASFWIHVIFNDLFIAHVPLIMGCIAHNDLSDKDTTMPASGSRTAHRTL